MRQQDHIQISDASEVSGETEEGSECIEQCPELSRLLQITQKHHQSGDDLESWGFLNTKVDNWSAPRTVSGTIRYIFLGMDHFQGWDMKKSNFPHSLSLSAQLSIWSLRGVGFYTELHQQLNWDPYEERKDTTTRQESGDRKPSMLRLWLQMPPGPEGGIAGTIICHPQWASLTCSHCVWLQPPVNVSLQIWLKRTHLASPRWETGRNAGSPDILASSSSIIGPEKTEPSKQIFIFAQWTALFVLKQKPTFLNKGVLLGRP